MTLAELKEKYHGLSSSTDARQKLKAKGYLEIIQLYSEKCNALESEPVMISLIAEEYINTQEKLYNILKKEEYKQKLRAGQECLISYMSQDEISKIFSFFKPEDTSLTNYLNYMKGAGYMNRIKYKDFVSAYNLILL